MLLIQNILGLSEELQVWCMCRKPPSYLHCLAMKMTNHEYWAVSAVPWSDISKIDSQQRKKSQLHFTFSLMLDTQKSTTFSLLDLHIGRFVKKCMPILQMPPKNTFKKMTVFTTPWYSSIILHYSWTDQTLLKYRTSLQWFQRLFWWKSLLWIKIFLTFFWSCQISHLALSIFLGVFFSSFLSSDLKKQKLTDWEFCRCCRVLQRPMWVCDYVCALGVSVFEFSQSL